MDQVEVDGLRIAYERVGAGPPVALVHGFVGDGRSTWERQMEALADAFTVVVWDAPGIGRSSDPPETFGIERYADCLVGFLEAIGIPRAHLVGLSFGGIVALSVAERHPQVLRSLSLVGGYAGWLGSLGPEDTEARLRDCLRLSNETPDEFVAAMIPGMFSESAPEAAVASFAATVRRFSPAGFRAMARACAEADLRDVLPDVHAPTLLVYGDKDVRAPLSVAEAIRSHLPGSRLVVLPGVGHVSPVESPDDVSSVLREFLLSVEVGAPHSGG